MQVFMPICELLGHKVSADGVEYSTSHIDDVVKWPDPYNVKEIQPFLGFQISIGTSFQDMLM